MVPATAATMVPVSARRREGVKAIATASAPTDKLLISSTSMAAPTPTIPPAMLSNKLSAMTRKNTCDPEKPMVTSGIRLGSPAGTTRGFGEKEFRQIADWIIEVVDGLAANGEDGNAAVENKVKAEVKALCARFPIYPNL